MMTIRRAADRGFADHGWLRTFHTFSFADYYDPAHMGFRSLRVINEDRVAPGQGFGTHGHRDMEIFSWVLDGQLAHQDSLGSGAVLKPGEAQAMSAGTGVRHSEFNGSKTEGVHFLQIWLMPKQQGFEPRYEQKQFPVSERQGQFRLVASPDGAQGSVLMQSDARLFAGLFSAGQGASVKLDAGRHAWVHVARGAVKVNGQRLEAGDGAAFSQTGEISVEGVEAPGEVLLFDLG